jgi:hypothetical protein
MRIQFVRWRLIITIMIFGSLSISFPGRASAWSDTDIRLVDTDVPPAPVLLSPANDSVLDNLIPVFEIDTGIPETASSLTFNLSLSPQFTAGQTTTTTACGDIWGHFDWYASPGYAGFPGLQGDSGNLLPGTRFYWRARTAYGNACGVPSAEWGPWSDVYSFVTGSGGVILPGPQLLNPPDGDTEAGLRPMFSWQPDSAALGMSLQVQGLTPGAGGWGLTSFNWPRTSYQPEWDLTPGASYQWRVFYRNEYAWGEPSSYWTFSVSLASLAIAGRVLDTTGGGLPGVIISDNSGHSAATGDAGEYRLDHLLAGTYTITPNRSGYGFCPAARTITIPPDATEQDFIGALTGSDACSGRIFLPAILKG